MAETYIVGSEKLPVELTGANVVDDKERLSASFEKDDNGKGALRVIDAAPFAYDPTEDKLKVITNNKNKITKEVIVPRRIIEGNASYSFEVTFDNESEIWFFVEASMFPWNFLAGTIYAPLSSLSDSLFPLRVDVPKAYWTGIPAVSLYLPLAPSSAAGLTSITSMNDARNLVLCPGKSTIKYTFQNKNAAQGEFIVSILRVWN